jgi:hypothetical protein
MSVVTPEEQKCGLSMHNFTVVIVYGTYMFQLQSCLSEKYKRKSYTVVYI